VSDENRFTGSPTELPEPVWPDTSTLSAEDAILTEAEALVSVRLAAWVDESDGQKP